MNLIQNKKLNIFFALLFCVISNALNAQTATVGGTVLANGAPVQYAQVSINDLNLGAYTNAKGEFTISKVPYGNYNLNVVYIGYKPMSKNLMVSENSVNQKLLMHLTEQIIELEDIVVTGTKTYKRQTNSPVIVNVINSESLNSVQACNLSDGLKFQPGLRVETDCQTCNYTQLRMNGLAGGYSQILINGRPIFSPLTGLYGLEQLPTNMIERIEVVRGGGSSLYGSSAIGGTVNVITKVPKNNSHSIEYLYQNIDASTNDHTLNANATLVSKNTNAGVSFFINKRKRGFYDANGDNFSEIPKVENSAIGANMFWIPTQNQKVELNLSHIGEYRFGGEMLINKPAHLAQQAEERTHKVWMASADYQINFNNEKSSFITYLAWQNTNRAHYTGIRPNINTQEYEYFLANLPYGTSHVNTVNVGTQLNHKVESFMGGVNVFTLGAEMVSDQVFDQIKAYNYTVDQATTDLGLFFQSDWQINSKITLLSGIRFDKHNLLKQPVFSPRASVLYKLKKNMQFRLSYGTGFRAPQAFDTDLHIAFAGGGVSRVALANDLKQERSKSYSASVNYDKPSENWVAGFTLQWFYTRLNDAFYLSNIGNDNFGELFEKQNGAGATVKGYTAEFRANFKRKIQLECGFTLQNSFFDQKVAYIDGLEGVKEFARTPNDYGFAVLTLTPHKKLKATVNYVYTGKMLVPHFAGAPNQTEDEIIISSAFSDVGV
ncbi:MAG: TonB-dependent receptor, partial [Bacteroidia bacterium]